MFGVFLGLSSVGLVFIIDSAKKAAEDKVLEQIVRDARARAKKAASAKENRNED